MAEAYKSADALNKADNLVRNASSNSTFPSVLNNSQIKTDLVNFITDGTKPKGDAIYSNIISTWGLLLFNNDQEINNKNFNFSSLKTEVKQKNIFMSWGNIKTISYTETSGNPSKDVIEANKLISKGVQTPPSTLNQNHD